MFIELIDVDLLVAEYLLLLRSNASYTDLCLRLYLIRVLIDDLIQLV